MIKKLFSKRSGFTLVEIVVAFAIFAIMSSMILQILNVIMNEKRSNVEFEEKLQTQEELIAKNGRTGTYQEAEKDGTISLNFPDGNMGIDYQMETPDGEDGLAYFIGPNAEGGNIAAPTDPVSSAQAQAGAQLDRMDTRITGTAGFDSINICKVVKDTTYGGPGVRYFFEVSAGASNMPTEIVPYAQYKLYFFMADEYDEVKSGVSYKNPDGSTYQKQVPKAAKIIDGGYINGPSLEWNDSTCVPFNSYINGSGYNLYNVKILNNNCIRVGCPYITTHPDGVTINYAKYGPRFKAGNHTRFYVVFAEDPKITTESFGEDFGSNLVKESSGRVNYSRVPILDDDGDVSDKDYVNIYGAFKFKTKT